MKSRRANRCSWTHTITFHDFHTNQLTLLVFIHLWLLPLPGRNKPKDERFQSYQCISFSDPESCSCRRRTERCQKSWKNVSWCRTEPRWTGSGCLGGEMGIEAEIRSRPVKNSDAPALPKDLANSFSCFTLRDSSDRKYLWDTGCTFENAAWVHSVPKLTY